MFEITKEPISIESIIHKIESRNSGAINTFIGTVREFTKEKKTLYLEYDAYEAMAVKKLTQIGSEIQDQWSESQVAISHRIGRLEISDIAVVIAVSSPHRNQSFVACRYAIERIKEMVPIWKKEHWEDGESWIGDQLEKKSYPSGKPTKEDLSND